MACNSIYKDERDPDAPYECEEESGHGEWHRDRREDWDVCWMEDGFAPLIELGEELSDWGFDWPKVNGHVPGTEKCDCGHEGLEPYRHMHDCPAVLAAWKARAKILHEQVWELMAEVKALDPEYAGQAGNSRAEASDNCTAHIEWGVIERGETEPTWISDDELGAWKGMRDGYRMVRRTVTEWEDIVDGT